MNNTETEQYHFLINARNFHYDNFNKWMTFFYVAVGAIFFGYYSIIEKTGLNFEKIIILSIGLLVSIFWHWSCKGYYYWITNFIELIKHYEKRFHKNNRVYFCFANKKLNNNYFNPLSGANISTSKVTLLFSFLVANIWDILLIKYILDQYFTGRCICFYILIYACGIITLYLLSSFTPMTMKSKIEDFPDIANDVDE